MAVPGVTAAAPGAIASVPARAIAAPSAAAMPYVPGPMCLMGDTAFVWGWQVRDTGRRGVHEGTTGSHAGPAVGHPYRPRQDPPDLTQSQQPESRIH
ncbi:hypothetical protein SSP35_10_00830 [Streptomyces sp. NBRC 110611]|nr:hypothetical protein SSP35_10_00830 [Streptomyces sp. NBRC 110611]